MSNKKLVEESLADFKRKEKVYADAEKERVEDASGFFEKNNITNVAKAKKELDEARVAYESSKKAK